MHKAILSIKINRINSFPGVDSISSISLLLNKIGERSSMEFKKILIDHENYIISKERLKEIESISDNLVKEDSGDMIKVHPENLKFYLQSLLEGIEEIYVVCGFSDTLDTMYSTELFVSLFYDEYVLRVFNTLDSTEKNSDLEFCQSNLKKFFKYIS
jgi:hypothetical protein